MNIPKKPKYPYFKPLMCGLIVGVSIGSAAIRADDIEVYRTQDSIETVNPNLLFILDESSSMEATDGDSTTRTEELRNALWEIFAEPPTGVEDANVAMMGYSKRKYAGRRVITTGNTTGFFDIDTNRADLQSRVHDIFTISGTTTVQAMASGVEWFESGFTDDDGDNDYDGCWTTKNECLQGTGVGTDTTVTTPVTEDQYCAQSTIILLTDGAPWSDQTSSNLNYNDPHPFKDAGYVYKGIDCTDPDPSGFSMSRAGCTGDIADWANSNDLFAGAGMPGTQNVVTHTIGFHTGSDERAYLEDIANRGGGNYYESSDTASLVAAIDAIIIEAQASIGYTFNAPVIPFNATNTAVSGDYIYVPLLKPEVTSFWRGNLKKYDLSVNETGIVLAGADGGTVLLPNGKFADTARSHWSTIVDGADPIAGGVVSHLYGTRNLYTYISGDVNLAGSTNNHVIDDNDLITLDLLGLLPGEETKRTAILEWINWTDGTHEGEMGAPIHSMPAIVPYGSGSDDDVVLVTTTEGVLHAFNAKNDTSTGGGDELWAFIPKELLMDIEELKTDAGRAEPLYGLDGPMTVYTSGIRTYVVVTMRRGGRNIYALDITNRTAPKFAWSIIGGHGELDRHGRTISGTAGFEDLAQTWSKPLFLSMEIAGASARDVLVFGGGYDTDQDGVDDSPASRANDDSGNAIYIVDAQTGNRLQTIANGSFGISEMNNGIAADLLPVDINANGITDRLYAADVGGRIIRVDIPDNSFAGTSISAGVIADINNGGTHFQRFFNTPEVAFFSRGGVQYLTILIGSGRRSNPLSIAVDDSFYMIKDPNVWIAPNTYQKVTRNQLYNTTNNNIQDGSAAEKVAAQSALLSASGWYINFPVDSGEKTFSKARVYDYAVLFVTYSGIRSGGGSPCDVGATIGESKFYGINMLTGGSVFAELGGAGDTLNTADRYMTINIPGMPPPVSLIFPATGDGPGEEVVATVGLQEVARWPDRYHAMYWEEVIGN